MVGIKGLGGIPEPQSDRPTKVRDDRSKDVVKTDGAKDDVIISSEAAAAASMTRTIQDFKIDPGIRTAKVAEARESIARGEYKQPEVVATVAARISKYLP